MTSNDLHFGANRPKFPLNFIMYLVKMGLGVGKFKNLFSSITKRTTKQSPVDIKYRNGLNLRLYPFDNTIENRILFSSSWREKSELQAIKQYITKDSVVLDIGANIGYYALNAAKFGAKKVLAIEPNPLILDRLYQNIKLNNLNKTIIVLPICLGGKQEKLSLSINTDDMGISTTLDNISLEKSIEVNSFLLGDVLKKEKIINVDILKIDVEGMEDKILFPYFEGIQRLFYPKLIIIEDNSDVWKRNILKWLLENGYKVHCKTRGNTVLLRE